MLFAGGGGQPVPRAAPPRTACPAERQPAPERERRRRGGQLPAPGQVRSAQGAAGVPACTRQWNGGAGSIRARRPGRWYSPFHGRVSSTWQEISDGMILTNDSR